MRASSKALRESQHEKTCLRSPSITTTWSARCVPVNRQTATDTEKIQMKAKSALTFGIAVVLSIVSWGATAQTKCSTDSLGNSTCRDGDGNTTRGRPDSLGNKTWRDSNGNAARGGTDRLGNTTLRDSDGNTTRGRLGNKTWRDSNGNTTRGSTDSLGNITVLPSLPPNPRGAPKTRSAPPRVVDGRDK